MITIEQGRDGNGGLSRRPETWRTAWTPGAVAIWVLPVSGPPISNTLSAPSMNVPRWSSWAEASLISLEANSKPVRNL